MELEQSITSNFVAHDILPALTDLIAPRSIDRQPNGAIVVRGQLLQDAASVYRPLRRRFEQLGYTPFIRPLDDGIELIAARGVVERRPLRWRLSLALFLATVLSVLLIGSLNELGNTPLNFFLTDPTLLRFGIPFAATLLSILFAHEMGHFVVSRWRGAPASLPYFIPMPITITGTLGAVIVQREPFEDRRTLMEVAVAGPLAGLVVAIPLLFYGLATSQVGQMVPPYIQEGNSIFYALAKLLVFGRWLPSNGVDVQINAITNAAWIGLLVTMFNLLPVGQLDGGHIAYALFGRHAEWIAYVMMSLALLLGLLGVAGIYGSSTWLVWVILLGLMGPRHPALFNEVLDLRPIHVVLGIVGLITFVLLFMPNPLTIVQ